MNQRQLNRKIPDNKATEGGPDRTVPINVVHQEEVRRLLEKLGLAAEHDNGTLSCYVCGGPLRELGVGLARRSEDRVVFACEQISCVWGLS
jgi:hypothetical protein